MAKEYLPLKVDPYRFADNATRVHGYMLVKNMPRLSGSLASDESEVGVEINFGVDQQGIRFMRGHLETHLMLQCQRCMESFSYEIISDFLLGIVKTDKEANELPESYDPLIIEEPDLYIQDVIEDELIVSLPLVPMHQVDECKVTLPLITESSALSEVEKDNPFKVIELLREKRDKK